jgi:copper oxidase (laccase) domain-containing protein
VVHAGWRGSSEKILKKTLESIIEKYACNMNDIILFIGPSICWKCYEVGSEVAELFPESIIQSWEKYFLDLRAENLLQALASWILRENIEISNECTFELPETYFSYRREKLKANFICGIGRK